MDNFFYIIYSSTSIIMAGVLLAFGICFLFLKIPKSDNLHYYKISRQLLALAYLSFGFVCALEFIMTRLGDRGDIEVTQYFSLVIASFQSVFVSFAIVTIINFKFYSKKRLAIELSPILLLTILLLFSFSLFGNSLVKRVLFFTLCGYYTFNMFKWVYLIFIHNKHAIKQMNDYFSGNESNYVNWIAQIGYLAAFNALIALYLILFPSWILAAIVTFFCLIIYSVLALRFLNYLFVFNLLDPLIEEVEEQVTVEKSFYFGEIEKALEIWIEKKGYLVNGVTINDLAEDFCTNRTYVSQFINMFKKMSFNEWINLLWIEEAKLILIEQSRLTVAEVSDKVGYATPSNFGRQFVKLTGVTPLNWRKQNTSPAVL